MMIRIMSELPLGVLGFEAVGKVTAQDYQTVMMPEVEQVIDDGERLRVIYYLGPDFESFTIGAMLDDALVGVGRANAWERIAIVSDKDWVHKSFGLFATVLPFKARIFPIPELATAVQWVAEEDS